MGLRPCGLAAGVMGVLMQPVGGFLGVLRPCGMAARSELEALWGALWGC